MERTHPAGLASDAKLQATRFLCFVFFAGHVASALAEDPVGSLAGAEPFAASAETLLSAAEFGGGSGDESGYYLLRSNRYEIHDGGEATETLHYIYHPETDAGRAMIEQVSAPWISTIQDRPVIRARVVDSDGTEHWLDQATVTEQAARDLDGQVLTDERILIAPLPRVEAGAVVEVEIVTRQVKSLLQAGHATTWTLFEGAPVRHLKIEVSAPSTRPLEYRLYEAADVAASRDTVDDRHVLTLVRRNADALQHFEWLTPRDVRQIPLVLISTTETWGAAAAHYREVTEAKLEEDVGPVLDRIVAPDSDRDETIRSIVEWLDREIRYTSLAFGPGRVIPRLPSETIARGYGDCKDKSILLVALLREAGIDAEVALLKAGPGPDVDESLPSLAVFDHVIVHVPGPEPLWLDPTSSHTPPGVLPGGDQDRAALIIAEGTSELTRTPSSSSGDNGWTSVEDIHLSETSATRIEREYTSRGAFDAGERQNLDLLAGMMTREEILQAANESRPGRHLVEWTTSDTRDLSTPFRSVEKYEARDMVLVTRGEIGIYPDFRVFLDNLPPEITRGTSSLMAALQVESEPTARLLPLELPVAFSATETVRIHLPAGYRPVDGQGDRNWTFGPIRLDRTIRQESETLVVVEYAFDTTRRVLSASETRRAWEQIQALNGNTRDSIVFYQVGERHLAAGETMAALTEFRRLMSLDETNGIAMARLAGALVTIGLIDAAQDYARRAAELEPDAYDVQLTLGHALAKNPAGIEFMPPFDAHGAETALVRAHEIDPGRTEAPWSLARLFELGPDGDYLGDDADPNRALGYYRSLIGRVNADRLAGRMLDILLALERYDELEAVATRFPQSTARDQQVLAAIAARDLGDVPAALDRMAPGREGRGRLLEGAASLLAYWRRYEPAAELYRLSLRYFDDPKIDMAIAVMESAPSLDRMTPPFSSIDDLAVAYARTRLDRPSTLVDFYAPSIRERSYVGFEINKTIGEARRFANMFARNPFPKPVNVDGIFLDTEIETTGDDATGYRIDLNAQPTRDLAIFAIREGGHYWILSSNNRAPLGERALHHLDREETAAARQWIDWAEDRTRVRWGRSATSDDPFGGDAFLQLLEAGNRDDPADLRAMALSLASLGDLAADFVGELQSLQEQARDESVVRTYDIALAEAYGVTGDHEALAALGERMLSQAPDSRKAFDHAALGNLKIGELDAVKALAEARLAEMPDDWAAMHALASYHDTRGEYDLSLPLYRRLMDVGNESPNDLNTFVWMSIMAGHVDDEALELAKRAARKSGFWSYPIMHTLATAYAEAGLVEDARRSLKAAMRLSPDMAHKPDDFYVLGRIAERLDLVDYARTAYGRVEPPADPSEMPMSTYLLAQRALATLPEATAGHSEQPTRQKGAFGVICGPGDPSQGAVQATVRAVLCAGVTEADSGGVVPDSGPR